MRGPTYRTTDTKKHFAFSMRHSTLLPLTRSSWSSASLPAGVMMKASALAASTSFRRFHDLLTGDHPSQTVAVVAPFLLFSHHIVPS